jgi:hypothetical protein
VLIDERQADDIDAIPVDLFTGSLCRRDSIGRR